MRRIALTLEYDGTDFVGWQIQPRGRTVQEELEAALGRIFQTDTRATAAGRTDTGVHALGQVVHFDTGSSMPLYRIRHALNGLLKPDTVVRDIWQAEPSFHARFDAIGREYCYRIVRHPTALLRHLTWHVPYDLDLEKMSEGCGALLGRHDFASFCQAASAAEGTECVIKSLVWQRTDSELRMTVRANRFLHHMVRTVVGTSVEIGRGRWECDRMKAILDGKDRKIAGPNAPPHGLCFVRVDYPAS